jgi:tripartite-type tricarboxylate transporter receptor subunit TctC
VARSAPDGYTFMLAASGGPMVAVVFLNKNVPYDPLKSFVSIGPAVEPVTLMVARPDLPGATFAEVVEAARAYPGKITVGSSGLGTEFHFMIEAMNLAGARFLHVPYKGTPQSMQDVVAGNLDITFGTVPSTRGLRNAGKLKVLAIASDKLERYAPLKDTPTIKEVLAKFVRSPSFYGFWGPSGMPEAIVSRLNAELVKAMALPSIRSWLDENGIVIIARSPSEARALHEESFDSYRAIAKAVGVEAQ